MFCSFSRSPVFGPVQSNPLPTLPLIPGGGGFFGIAPTIVSDVIHHHPREGYYIVNNELRITNDHLQMRSGGSRVVSAMRLLRETRNRVARLGLQVNRHHGFSDVPVLEGEDAKG